MLLYPHPVYLASDHAGYPLKEAIKDFLTSRVGDLTDLGTHDLGSVDYSDYGHEMAKTLLATKNPNVRGILVCGTGIGISIAANRHHGIRAALCQSGFEAKLARLHNDANVLALGGRLLGVDRALNCVEVFLTTEFEGGRHERRVQKLDVEQNV